MISNKNLYTKIATLSDSIKERRILFYCHLVRINNSWLTKQVFYFLGSKKKKTLKRERFIRVADDMKEFEITDDINKEREVWREILKDQHKRFLDV